MRVVKSRYVTKWPQNAGNPQVQQQQDSYFLKFLRSKFYSCSDEGCGKVEKA